MTTDDLTERVAEALASAGSRTSVWAELREDARDEFRRYARAALAVIEEVRGVPGVVQQLFDQELTPEELRERAEMADDLDRALGMNDYRQPEPISVADAREAVAMMAYYGNHDGDLVDPALDALIAVVRADELDKHLRRDTATAEQVERYKKLATEREVQGARDVALLGVLFDLHGCDCDGSYKGARWRASDHASNCPAYERWDAFVERVLATSAPTQETPEKSNRAV